MAFDSWIHLFLVIHCSLNGLSLQVRYLLFYEIIDAMFGQVNLRWTGLQGSRYPFYGPLFEHIQIKQLILAWIDLPSDTPDGRIQKVSLPFLLPLFLQR